MRNNVGPVPVTITVDPRVLRTLLLRCAQRDEEAFAEYYRLTSPFLHAITKRRIRSSHLVEAALVRVYVTIWYEAANFLGSDTDSAWQWTLTMVDQVLSDQRLD